MKKEQFFFLAIAILTLTSIGCRDGAQIIYGSDTLVSVDRAAQPFTTVAIDGVAEVIIEYSETPYLEVIANDNIIEDIMTDYSGDRLTIGFQDNTNYNNVDVTIYAGTPTIQSIDKDGVGTLEVLDFYDLDRLEVTQDGVGDVILIGSADRLVYEHDGVGSLEGFDFVADRVDITTDGVGNSEVNAVDSLRGELNGVGSIYYKGNPSLNIDDDGVGRVIDAN